MVYLFLWLGDNAPPPPLCIESESYVLYVKSVHAQKVI